MKIEPTLDFFQPAECQSDPVHRNGVQHVGNLRHWRVAKRHQPFAGRLIKFGVHLNFYVWLRNTIRALGNGFHTDGQWSRQNSILRPCDKGTACRERLKICEKARSACGLLFVGVPLLVAAVLLVFRVSISKNLGVRPMKEWK